MLCLSTFITVVCLPLQFLLIPRAVDHMYLTSYVVHLANKYTSHVVCDNIVHLRIEHVTAPYKLSYYYYLLLSTGNDQDCIMQHHTAVTAFVTCFFNMQW